MTDPERLLSTTEDDFEQRILRAARRDVGSDAALKRTLGALRIAAGAGAGAAAANAAAAAPLHGAGAGAAGAASLGKIVGFVAIGAVAGTLATGSTVLVFAPARPAASVSAPHAEAPLLPLASRAIAKGTASPEALVEAPRGTPAENAARLSVDTGSSPEAASNLAPPRAAVHPMPNDVRPEAAADPSNPTESSALTSELGALEGARNALDRGRPALALELIDAYEGRFPNGVLRPEAVVLRIDALARMGDHTTAGNLAKRFLASHPGTPHAAHLRALISEQRK